MGGFCKSGPQPPALFGKTGFDLTSKTQQAELRFASRKGGVHCKIFQISTKIAMEGRRKVECIVFGQRGHARPTTKSDISAEEKTITLQGSEGAGEEGRRDPMPFRSKVQGS
ncbi:hypothetical protein NQZ68_010698 [Dissostichus eleginoides]|nr:hypothetical protein NQZ68_010698 [Dissostichus eleginoides]